MPTVAVIKTKLNEASANLKLARKIDDDVLIAFWTEQMDGLLDEMLAKKAARRTRRKQPVGEHQ